VRNYVSAVNEDDSLRATRELETHGPVVADHAPINSQAEVVLTAMSFLDADGREREVFHNGESMHVRTHYHANILITSPVCEIGIEHHQGETVTLTSTRMAEYSVADLLPGDGYIEWRIDHLLLTPGTYYFSPRLYEASGIYIFDQHPRWYRIRVHAGRYKERNGIVVMPGIWSQAVTGALDEPARV
jgi:Wzt C-terminal domain